VCSFRSFAKQHPWTETRKLVTISDITPFLSSPQRIAFFLESTMANIAAFMCGLMLAQVERDNKRAAKRRLRAAQETDFVSSSSSSIINTLNEKTYARLQQRDSSLKELRITQDFFNTGDDCRLRNKLSFGSDHKWRKARKALLRHGSLKKLEIHSTLIEDRILSDTLQNMPQLTHLSLYNNHIGDAGACALAKSLETSKRTLLKSLVLDNNHIFNDGAARLATALASSHLICLSLQQNFISSVGAAALSRMLSQHTCSLESLNLSRNFIHSAGAQCISHALTQNTSLRELDVSYNDNEVTLECLGDAGAKAFGSMLAKNTHLEVLKLSGNHIGPTGCAALAKGLACNRGLKELHLDDNSIGIEGFLALCRALETNTTLQVLSLQGTMVPIERNVQQALLQALKMNGTMTHLYSSIVSDECALLLELNRGLRGILKDDDFATALWPFVLERASKEPSLYMQLNLVYYALKEKSDLFRPC
jgi:Ran GTPase-activating protein (RanGAP) involved in mRNA processing and transport